MVNGLWKPDDLKAAAEEAEKRGESPEVKKAKSALQTAEYELHDLEDDRKQIAKSGDKDAKAKNCADIDAKKEEIEKLKKDLAAEQKKFKKSGGDPEELLAAAKLNRDEFKKVENISGLEKLKQAHNRKFDRWEPSIEELAKNGVPEGKEEAISKAVFKGGVDVKRTPIDFYIIPMKGLRDGEGGGEKASE